MNYNLNTTSSQAEQKKSTLAALRKLFAFMKDERKIIIIAFVAMFVNATLNLLGPVLIGHTIDAYVMTKQYHGVLVFSGILFCMFVLALATSYLQTKMMGTVGQRML
jgi:ATP-binding cassette, subfamily B, bacterial